MFAASPVAEVSLAQVDASSAVLSDLYVFGDSLSDTGDLFEMTGGIIPLPPYSDGRFSNGPLWIEQLADSLGLELTDENNWSVGGALSGFENLADQLGIIEFPGVLERVLSYAAEVGPGGADPDALYVVWAGANDFLGLTSFDPATVQATLENAVSNIVTAAGTLGSLGAENILVPSLPDLGLTPKGAASGFGPQLSAVTGVFNATLDAALDQLALTGIDTIRMDFAATQQAIVANPELFGLTDATTPYLLTGLGQDPDDYLFFDDQHPTTAGHDLIAEVAREALYDAGLLPSLSFTAGQSVRYTDASGDRVTIKLTGPGAGEVRLLGDRSDASQIVLTGTTSASTLHISVAGGKKGGTTVYDILVNGSLGKINAPNVDLIGDVLVTNQLAMMHIDDFVGSQDQTIEIRGEAQKRNSFRLIADNPREATIETNAKTSVINKGPIFRALQPLLSFLRK